jgi:predicted ester cyclase
LTVAVEGPEGVKRLVGGLHALISGVQIIIEDMIAEGDKVVTRYMSTGMDTGGFMDRAPTGKQVRFTAIQIFRMVDGKIVESWANRDDLGVLQQLGVIPVPGQARR